MCNSSIIINSSALFLQEGLSWFCMCKDRFGTFFIIYTSILWFTVGTLINCWSLWVLLRRNIKPNMVFSLSMTILELIVCMQSFVDFIDFMVSNTVSYNITTFLSGLGWTARALLQMCMCIEQYLAVICPVTFLRYKGIQYRIALVTVAWLIAMGNGFRLVSIRLNFFRDHVYLFVFCIAVIVTSFCCVSVLRALKRPGPGDHNNVKMTKKDRNKADTGGAVKNQQKRKAFRIISNILISILVCYLPIVVVYFMCLSGVRAYSFLCDAVPPFLAISKINLLISPLVRMYSEGHSNHIMCFSKFRGLMTEN